MEVLSKIQEIMAKQLSIDASTVTAEKEIVKDLGADSLELFEILTVVEERQALHFPADAVNSIRTIADAVRLLEETEHGKR